MHQKKIIFAIDQLGMGGAENMIVQQVNHIDRKIFKVYLITLFSNPKVNVADKIDPDVTYVQFNFRSPFSGLLDISSWWRLYKFFRKEKFDVVDTNLFITNIIVRIVAIFAGVPVILSNELNVYKNKKYWQICIDKILARFTKVIFASSSEVLEFTAEQEHLSKDKFCLNYNAIPLKLFKVKENRNKVLTEFALPTDSFYIVTAGRLIVQKGHKYLLEAAQILKKQGISNFKVLIFGQGVLEEEISKQIISLGLEYQVKLMGLSSMDNILAISDTFVLPSLWEGLSIALLQAMDSGSVIVATDISGSREAIINGTSGLVVSSGDSEKLASALSTVMKDTQLRTKLSRGALEQVKKFSIEANVKIIEREALK